MTALADTGERVVLVDRAGHPVGSELKSTVHGPETPLHLAFSAYVFDDAGRVLLTRRALTKATWPGVWTNSCCGHPGLGEDLETAVRRRLDQELGLRVGPLTCVLPDFAYSARDASGVQENEICPVFAARALHPNPEVGKNTEEVMDLVWADWDAVVSATAATPFAFSPWAVLQVASMGALGRAYPGSRGA